MSLRLKAYLILMGALAVGLLVLSPIPELERRWLHYLAWTAICFASESLWLSTLSGEGTASMASTANIALLLLWGTDASIWIVSVSTLLANILLQKRPWERAVFNTSMSAVTTWVTGVASVLLGGPAHGMLADGVSAGQAGIWRLAPAFVGMCVVYVLVGRALVSVAVAWSTNRPYRRVLKEDWFYRDRLYDDMALFLLSPLMVVCYESLRYVGLLLFWAPLRIIYESSKRYAELRSAQNMLIHSERMAAKGEMAAEIGHELRNQLVAVSGRAQLLIRDADRQQYGNVGRYAQIILEQAHRVEAMSKGLMGFSRAELKMERVELVALVKSSVEFVRTQKRFDGVEWDIGLPASLPELKADPGQLQQVLLNLFINAADAMNEPPLERRVITVRSEFDERKRRVKLLVSDTGPGIPTALLPKIFEPHFTTKVEGHGFGLSTSYRIVTNHGGQIVADGAPGQGALFTITLPVEGPGGWSK